MLSHILPRQSFVRGVRFQSTYREGKLVASVLQLVITGIEGEGLHNVGSSPQELPVQLSHFKSNRSHHEEKTLTDPVKLS